MIAIKLLFSLGVVALLAKSTLPIVVPSEDLHPGDSMSDTSQTKSTLSKSPTNGEFGLERRARVS